MTLTIGVYVFHSRASSFLQPGTLDWVAGPPLAEPMQCAVQITKSGFVVVGGVDLVSVREFDASLAGPTSVDGWLPVDTWPRLETTRFYVACEAVGGKLIVAGGGTDVDIIDIHTKAVARGNKMLKSRSYMQFVTFGEDDYTRLLALGGLHDISPIADVEFWEEDSGYWLEAWGRLRTARSHAGAVALRPEIVCSGPCQEHNCPVVQGTQIML